MLQPEEMNEPTHWCLWDALGTRNSQVPMRARLIPDVLRLCLHEFARGCSLFAGAPS